MLLAGLLAEAKERAACVGDDECELLDQSEEMTQGEVLRALEESDLLTGNLLRASKDVLTHLDPRTYGPGAAR